MSPPSSSSLPIAHAVLRVLVLLNWAVGGCILALLIYTVINEPWAMKGLGISEYPNAPAVLAAMRVIAALGVGGVLINYYILKRLLGMIDTVRAGDPFIRTNAHRLIEIAWALLALQVLSLAIGGIAKAVSTAEHPFDLEAGFSVNGWLAVILTFVLAHVFEKGSSMREDLEGTV